MLVTIRDSLRALIEGDLSANDTYALLDGLFTAQERFTGRRSGTSAVSPIGMYLALAGLTRRSSAFAKRPSSCT